MHSYVAHLLCTIVGEQSNDNVTEHHAMKLLFSMISVLIEEDDDVESFDDDQSQSIVVGKSRQHGNSQETHLRHFSADYGPSNPRGSGMIFVMRKLLYGLYRVAQKIWLTFFVCLNLTDFHNYFTVRITRKFVIILSLKIPPHLKSVAAVPCEMSLSVS